MGKPSKVDAGFIARVSRKTAKRKVGFRKPERFILIVCEGAKTEPNYFLAIQDSLPKGRVVIDIEGTGMNTLSLVEKTIQLCAEAKRLKNRVYDDVWAVFDRDSFPEQSFNNAIAKAKGNKVQCAWSNEAFELWYVLHFQYRNTAMRREDYGHCISKELTKRMGTKFTYKKNDPNMYSLLHQYGDESAAISNAEKLAGKFQDERFAAHNPCTLVHHLVKQLNSVRRLHEMT
jgi:hypothetical protein